MKIVAGIYSQPGLRSNPSCNAHFPSFSMLPLIIAGRQFRSRLFLGTGKFPSLEAMRDALDASGAEIVTVALRRADLSGQRDPFANILEFIDPEKYLLLPNTSGAMNAAEAVRLARLAAAAGLPKWVKLEIHPDPTYLLPDPIETLKAAEILVNEGFTVLPYINADPVLAKRLQEVGTATVMPLGSPIGSNRGLATRDQLRIIIEQATVPVVVDAGIGAPSHAAEAMELGADAVLVNTAIAIASDPSRMAIAFKMAVEAGRSAYEMGLPEVIDHASPTSPLTGFLG
jgi:thiazole synthase